MVIIVVAVFHRGGTERDRENLPFARKKFRSFFLFDIYFFRKANYHKFEPGIYRGISGK